MKNGYGKRGHKGKTVLAHRLAYADSLGLPLAAIDGQQVRHACDNRACVNPDHLALGTHADNMRDMVERGRGRNAGTRGDGHARSKLSVVEVRNLRLLYEPGHAQYGCAALAREYGVGTSTMHRALTGASWGPL